MYAAARRRRFLPLLLFPAMLVSTAGRHLPVPSVGVPLPLVVPNDNRTPAGRMEGGELRVALVVQAAEWRPEAPDGPRVILAAVGEEDGPPQIPAPLLRVPLGTTIVATLRNSLSDSTLHVYGFGPRPQSIDAPTAIAPGMTHTFRFVADQPGTFAYRVMPGRIDPEIAEREQLAGALVVDAPGERTDDRIFVINIWGDPVDSTTYRNALAINGRAWPWTEPLRASVGDTLRWRIVNASVRPHPMHLHGFYFTVESRADPRRDTIYEPAMQRLVVTEPMRPFTTMKLRWVAERPGNWLFHCHLAFHVVPEVARLDPADSHARHSGDAGQHMAGLVLGIAVAPSPAWTDPPRTAVRALRLHVNEGRPRGGIAPRALGFVLQQGERPPAPDSLELPGGVLVLTRDQPTDITVVNHLREGTAVHWHGIELESWSDGVAGWSGSADRLAPLIAPGDSFVARLTLPRAGTFIYHTHMNDIEQLTSGLYGAIVVLEPGQRFDPSRDHVYVTGWDGDSDPPVVLFNGAREHSPLTVQAGVSQRFRFVNIGPALRIRYELRRDSALVQWRPLAKDGADLPEAQRRRSPASTFVMVGETHDMEVLPEPGEYTLLAYAAPANSALTRLIYSRRITAR